MRPAVWGDAPSVKEIWTHIMRPIPHWAETQHPVDTIRAPRPSISADTVADVIGAAASLFSKPLVDDSKSSSVSDIAADTPSNEALQSDHSNQHPSVASYMTPAIQSSSEPISPSDAVIISAADSDAGNAADSSAVGSISTTQLSTTPPSVSPDSDITADTPSTDALQSDHCNQHPFVDSQMNPTKPAAPKWIHPVTPEISQASSGIREDTDSSAYVSILSAPPSTTYPPASPVRPKNSNTGKIALIAGCVLGTFLVAAVSGYLGAKYALNARNQQPGAVLESSSIV